MFLYATLTLGRITCEYECLKFAINSPKSCDLMVNMFSVVLTLLTNILRIIRTPYQQYQWLTKCLRKSMANYRLHNIRWMYIALRIAALTEWRMFLRTWIFEFRVEFVKNVGWKVNIFISVSPLDLPRSALSLPNTLWIYYTNAYQSLPMPLRTLQTLTHALPSLPMLTKGTPNDRLRNIRWNWLTSL